MKTFKSRLSVFLIHAIFFTVFAAILYIVFYTRKIMEDNNIGNSSILDFVILYIIVSMIIYIFVHVKSIKKLRTTESTLKDLLLNNKDSWIWETDENFIFKKVDGYYYEILGLKSDDIIGKNAIELLGKENEKEIVRKLMAKLKSDSEPLVDFEEKFTSISNETQFIRLNVLPIKNKKGKLIGFRGINKDISARKNLENHLSYANYRIEETISAYNKINVWEYEPATSLINVLCYNYQYSEIPLNPYEIKTLAGLISIMHPEDVAVLKDVSRYYINGGKEPRNFRFRVKNDENKWILFNASLFPVAFDDNDNPIKVIGLNRYIPSIFVDDKFKKQQIFLETILSNIPLGVFAKDPNDNWNYIIWNKYMSALFKRNEKEVIGKNDFNILSEKAALSYFESNEKFMKSEKIVDKTEEILILPDKTPVTCVITRIKIFDVAGNVEMVLMTMEDISRQKRMEMELRQAQKMDAMGRLAGGIAHNFNNLLQVIIGYSEMLSYNLDGVNKKSVERIIDATQNARNMTKQLLAFSRKERLKLSTININSLLHSFIDIATKIISERIEIFFDEGKDIPDFIGDETLVSQIFMNLFINAKDAMNEKGSIYVKTGSIEFSKKTTIGNLLLEKGLYVVVSVKDTGPGIPYEIIGSIFDPFFTTKEEGKGTGLGLATVYGIVQDHRGAIEVGNAPDCGAVFTIYFPATKEF